ncbi:unnamed protein product [Pieris macdunnoughi]|uniref:Uncharacterized protein n=1 Tax=Pieris macdunnoughi TaxID=345717 RepID=A0A821S204_9NEOP|nr:unnamed protein product [Pieris macdunnoughi]
MGVYSCCRRVPSDQRTYTNQLSKYPAGTPLLRYYEENRSTIYPLLRYLYLGLVTPPPLALSSPTGDEFLLLDAMFY